MESSPGEFIQGVGNEVFYFFLFVSCLLMLVGAWFSTQVVEPIVSSVILVERRRVSEDGSGISSENQGEDYLQLPQDHLDPVNGMPVSGENSSSLISPQSSDINRHLPRNPLEVNLQASAAEASSSANDSALEQVSSPHSGDDQGSEANVVPEEDKVTVRLKFLNDTQRDVEASLMENIGNFKRRNFTDEMSENKNVRLIFNGQVLREETNTLRSYGIFDKCVVHCLIHQGSNPSASQSNGNSDPPVNEDDFDVSELMIPVLGVGLIVLWYFAFTYSTFFNTMSSTALLGLTSLFLFSVYSTNFHVNVAVRAR